MRTPMRISVVGTSGSGKSTLARRLGAALDLPVIELDAINWQPGWRDLNEQEPETFSARVAEAIVGDHWVTDGNYSRVRPMIMDRITHFVWLDYARTLVMWRVVLRSFGRAISGRELWPGTGNTEGFSRWLDPGHPIRWAWSTHKRRRTQYGEMMRALPPGITRHHLRHPAEAEALIAGLFSGEPSGLPRAEPLAS